MKIYIDSEYKCHALPGEDLREFDVPYFDGKCQTFIEGYRYIPLGEKWVMANGEFFRGETRVAWKDSQTLEAIQAAYEEGQATSGGTDEEKHDMQAALELLGVNPNG